jgi:phosphoribosylaminoimidazolecarboxamide formyltransferase/IMP cyclohydrolase
VLSTGGTARALRDAGIPVTDVSEVTGFPEILDGRVKTLHPGVHAGILCRRDNPDDMATLAAHGMAPIDLVAVNLYPFESTVADPSVTMRHALENIDIGGPTMLRAAAKNWPHVIVASDPGRYGDVIDAIAAGGVGEELRQELASATFAQCARYNQAIATYLARGDRCEASDEWPEVRGDRQHLRRVLRYGENPHQRGAFYVGNRGGSALAGATQLQGKPLSYNNLLDLDGGWRLAQALPYGSAVVVKHRNPCGVACADTLEQAFADAWAGDSLSAFGGVIVLRGAVGAPLATAITENFVEVLAAESVDDAAREVLAKKKKLVVVTTPELGADGAPVSPGTTESRSIAGGILTQDTDSPEPMRSIDDALTAECVTDRAPTPGELRSLTFAWHVCRYVQSNGIVFTSGTRSVGIGCGQTSRVDAVELAIRKAGRERHDLTGSAMASDAFFPFSDSVERAAEAGCTAVVQPGGSRRDGDSIEAANRAGITMLMTGRRSFRH